jgi:uncharacterized protein YqhQ
MSSEAKACPQTDTAVNIGGQAVIDGVMMRAPGHVATAVRLSDDHIVVQRVDYLALTKRYPILSLPVLRGAVSLFESLIIGTNTLNWSAEIAQEGESSEYTGTLVHRVLAALSIILAFGVGILLFMYLPYYAVTFFGFDQDSQLVFHLIVGSLRMGLLLGYLWVIAQWEDVGVLFAYHGAEHKAIFSWEVEGEVTVQKAATHTRFHPRCGTSFLLIVALSTVIVYAFFDSFWINYIGEFRTAFHRLLIHIPVIPIVAGFSFEALHLSSRHSKTGLAKLFITPGLWFQRLTTREPDEKQIEVAVVAIRASLDLPMDGIQSRVEFL